jgi:hypothetical protein
MLHTHAGCWRIYSNTYGNTYSNACSNTYSNTYSNTFMRALADLRENDVHSPPRRLASSPPRRLASSPPRLLASSPPRLLASPPPRLLASSPPRLLASSPLVPCYVPWCPLVKVEVTRHARLLASRALHHLLLLLPLPAASSVGRRAGRWRVLSVSLHQREPVEAKRLQLSQHPPPHLHTGMPAH